MKGVASVATNSSAATTATTAITPRPRVQRHIAREPNNTTATNKKKLGNAAASTTRSQRAAQPFSFVTQAQREALRVPAFGRVTQDNTAMNTPQEGSMLQQQHFGGDADTAASTRAQELTRSLHTSGQAKAVVARAEKESVRFHLCVQALAEGCIQTYIHLYDLSHRDPVCVDALSQRYFALPDDKLTWVQEQLSSIEVLRRQSEFREVFIRCQTLADYFEYEKDLKEAAWHYEAALRTACESLDKKLEQDVRVAFARFYERTGQLPAAEKMYLAMHRLASAMKDDDTARDVCVQLVRVYHALGERLRSSNTEAARLYFEKSARYAKRGKRGIEEGEAYSALGEIHEQTGRLQRALVFQRSYRNVAQREEMAEQECKAVLNVAGLEGRLGMTDDATQSLQAALKLATELADDAKVCRATMQLGEVYRSKGDDAAAMECFKESFRAACASGQRELIDSARVAMGFAIGGYYFTHAGEGKGYLPIVCNDIRAQLDWLSTGKL